MWEYDDSVLQCFLEKQEQLFDRKVAESLEEAADFLEECLAVVVHSKEEVLEYFEEEGIDVESADADAVLEADEVVAVGGGRYLIVIG